MSRQRLGAFLAVVLVGATAGLAAPAPATASGGYCPKGTGATVVVDNGSLGGGTSIGCDPQGANTPGSTVVPRAGYSLTYVTRQPGFVCRVAGAPASASCESTPPADAYWGLFWSDGKSGTWNYSSVGIGSLKVPAGGFIGLRFQSSSTRTNPGTAPVAPAGSGGSTASPKPSPKPSSSPTRATSPGPTGGTSGGGTGQGGTATTAGPTGPAATKAARKAAQKAAAKRAAKASASASSSASASASVPSSPSSSAEPTTAATDDREVTDGARASSSGPLLPIFAGGLPVVLLGAAGTLAWRRRRV